MSPSRGLRHSPATPSSQGRTSAIQVISRAMADSMSGVITVQSPA